jgi:hypothetical protein
VDADRRAKEKPDEIPNSVEAQRAAAGQSMGIVIDAKCPSSESGFE